MSKLDLENYQTQLQQELTQRKQVLYELEQAQIESKIAFELEKNKLHEQVNYQIEDIEISKMGLALPDPKKVKIDSKLILQVLNKMYKTNL